jgi:hypothetical protein
MKKMNKIDIVSDFTKKLDELSSKFNVKIESDFEPTNKSKFFDLTKTDEIKGVQISLIIKNLFDDNKIYEYVHRNKRFGVKKFDKLYKELTELFDWFKSHSNLNSYHIYMRNDELLDIIVTFKLL